MDIIGGFIYNFVLIVAFFIASIASCFLSSRGKTLGIFIAGIIIQSFAVYGGITVMIRNPEWVSSSRIMDIVIFVFLTVVGIVVLTRWTRPSEEKEDAVTPLSGMSNAEIIKFICGNCGTKQTGWYQTCPQCGAKGKIRKGDNKEIILWNTSEPN